MARTQRVRHAEVDAQTEDFLKPHLNMSEIEKVYPATTFNPDIYVAICIGLIARHSPEQRERVCTYAAQPITMLCQQPQSFVPSHGACPSLLKGVVAMAGGELLQASRQLGV